MKTPIQINSDSDLKAIAAQMRFGARRELVKEAPVYAKNHTELLDRLEKDYLPRMDEILADPRGALMLFGAEGLSGMNINFAILYGKAQIISAVSSIDVLNG